MFIIVNKDGETWNNEWGWVDDDPTVFTQEERNTFAYIPLGGHWKQQ